MNDEVQLERLEAASIKMSAPERETYLAQPDVLPASRTEIPKGYKRCTKCGTVKKIYMFNRNAEAKDGCTSQCKDCQKRPRVSRMQKTSTRKLTRSTTRSTKRPSRPRADNTIRNIKRSLKLSTRSTARQRPASVR